MEKRHGLGRGLGNLLGGSAGNVPISDGLLELPIDTIDPNPQQPRQIFDAEALSDLERSIRELGVLVPILVRSNGERYELIAGERRLRASKAAGLHRIPAIIRTADDEQSLELAVVENLQRENLDPIEEAMGFAHLIRDYNFTQDKLAQRLGKSRPAIANSLRLLDLADDLKAMVQRNEMSAGHARAILTLSPQRRAELAQKIVKNGISVREVERLVRREKLETDMRGLHKKSVLQSDRELEYDGIEEALRQHFATQVRVIGKDRGQLEITYTSHEDLTRIVDVILGTAPAA